MWDFEFIFQKSVGKSVGTTFWRYKTVKLNRYGIFSLLLLFISLTGCGNVQNSPAGVTVIYCITTIVSLIIVLSYFFTAIKGIKWFLLLFSSVFVVNFGYFLGAVSENLEQSLYANRISYLGSVFLPFSMFMIILKITGINYKKILPILLAILSLIIFLIAASPGILTIYYKEVSFDVINGVGTLIKVYGPLHTLYLVYLLGYFAVMSFAIFYNITHKKITSISHSLIMLVAVFINLCVWFIEQLVDIDFELLSVSYLISEIFLLGLSYIIHENEKLEILLEKEKQISKQEKTIDETLKEEEKAFLNAKQSLTKTELKIFDLYIKGFKTKDVLEIMNIKENTLKFHNKNIYGKFFVSSKKDLINLNDRFTNRRHF